MGRNPLYHNVVGAPFKVDEPVYIAAGTDETFDSRCKCRIGIVEYFEYECGCGQSYPKDPMIGVRFPNGRVAEFWAEELVRHPVRSKGRPRVRRSS